MFLPFRRAEPTLECEFEKHASTWCIRKRSCRACVVMLGLVWGFVQEALKQEEELQVQLATRASLAPPLHSHAEALSFKYWSTGRCAFSAAVPLPLLLPALCIHGAVGADVFAATRC